MKIAISTSGTTLDGGFESRFGRTLRFIAYDLEKETFDLIDNQHNANAPQGAGIQAAETIARCKAEASVTGHCGPKAFRVLHAAGFSIYHSDATTVAEALEKFRSGQLARANSSAVQGHWA